MYVQGSMACSEPNSETPISARANARQIRLLTQVQNAMENGNADMAGLVNGLTPPVPTGTCDDLTSSRALFSITSPFPVPVPPGFVGTPGAPASGAVDTTGLDAMGAAVPDNSSDVMSGTIAQATGSPSGTAAAVGAGPSVSSGPSSTVMGPGLRNGMGRRHVAGRGFTGRYPYGGMVDRLLRGQMRGFECGFDNSSVVAKTAAVIPVPRVVAGPSPAVVAPTATPAAAAGRTQADCRTANICIDLRNGCVRSDQVSPEQEFACSKAGYAGNMNYFPDVIAALPRPAPFLGTPMPNPPPFSTVPNQGTPAALLNNATRGMSGFLTGSDGTDYTPYLYAAGAIWLLAFLYNQRRGR